MTDKVAILLDGGFVKKVLQRRLSEFPQTTDIVQICTDIMNNAQVLTRSQGTLSLFRVFFYDAPPYEGTTTNPLDGSTLNFSLTKAASQNRALLDSLELEPDFAVRRGFLAHHDWKLGSAFLRRLRRAGANSRSVSVTANDLVPDMQQKGVDLRIGLDIALLAVKRIVDILVLVTGDSDFVPAMKLARKEGVRVYLQTLGNPVHRDLKVHADLVIG